MALSRVKTWQAGDVLTAADLNAEFNNVLNNGQSLVQPWVGTFDLDGNTLVLDGDADTSIDCATDDTIDITIAGADDFRLTANTLTALSGSSIAVTSGNITVTAGNLTITDGATSLADADARTDTVATPLTITAGTSGTPAAGIGTGILLRAQSADETPSDLLQFSGAFSDVTAGSEDSYGRILLRVAGAALTEVYRFVATGAFKAIFTHANSADRTYTLPNFDGTLATLAGSETLTNKVLSGAIIQGNAPASPTANGLYTDSLVKGFVKFQADGTIDTDLNVSSITDHAAGDWTVNWATSFASANYAVFTMREGQQAAPGSDSDTGGQVFEIQTQATGSVRINHVAYIYNSVTPAGERNGVDPTRVHVIAVGLQ